MIIMQYTVFVSFSVTGTITNFLFVGKTNKIHKCIVSVFYFIMFNTSVPDRSGYGSLSVISTIEYSNHCSKGTYLIHLNI